MQARARERAKTRVIAKVRDRLRLGPWVRAKARVRLRPVTVGSSHA